MEGADVGRLFQPRRGLEQANRLGTHRLRHAAGLAVGPGDTAVVEIDPGPFELEDLGHSGCKLELQPDGEEDERVLQAMASALFK